MVGQQEVAQESIAQTVDEMIASARAVKGDGFTNAAVGVFELLQVAGIVEKVAKPGAVTDGAQALLRTSMLRMLAHLGEKDAGEALALAQRLEARRSQAEKNWRGK